MEHNHFLSDSCNGKYFEYCKEYFRKQILEEEFEKFYKTAKVIGVLEFLDSAFDVKTKESDLVKCEGFTWEQLLKEKNKE